MAMGTSTKVTHIKHPDTHGRWERESVWDIDRKTERERETSRDIQRERERVGMGER